MLYYNRGVRSSSADVSFSGDTIFSGPKDLGSGDPRTWETGSRDTNWHTLNVYIRVTLIA